MLFLFIYKPNTVIYLHPWTEKTALIQPLKRLRDVQFKL